MTRERKEEVILVSLVISLALHIGLMVYARPRVMTTVVGVASRLVTRGPMRITKAVSPPEPVKIESVGDQAPRTESPAPLEGPSPLESAEPDVATPVPVERALADVVRRVGVSPVEKAPVFDAQPVNLDRTVSEKIPVLPIEVPKMPELPPRPAVATAKTLPAPVGREMPLPSLGTDPDSVFLPVKIASAPSSAPKFVPTAEVRDRVEEKVVEMEKNAVKDLVNAEKAADLSRFVDLTIVRSPMTDGTCFKVTIAAKRSLSVVPKDVVLILDASGSIGSDRLGSIRKATKRILRTVTNTGDRFNLVAFRDRFSYAFRSWQACDKASFEASDGWLNNLVAHGRTDVFSTISSVLTLPRDPARPLIALVVTDGDANEGVSDTAEILSRFAALNDGLVSVYMYGVKSSANRALIDRLTQENRGESLIFDGWRWNAGEGLETLSADFRDPVLSDLRLIFAADCPAEMYPRLLRNIYRDRPVSFVGKVGKDVKEIAFSLRGLNAAEAYEGFFKLSLAEAPIIDGIDLEWRREREFDILK